MSKVDSWLHDLRAPLARAKTVAKLLLDCNDSAERKELERMLLEALEELDSKMSEIK